MKVSLSLISVSFRYNWDFVHTDSRQTWLLCFELFLISLSSLLVTGPPKKVQSYSNIAVAACSTKDVTVRITISIGNLCCATALDIWCCYEPRVKNTVASVSNVTTVSQGIDSSTASVFAIMVLHFTTYFTSTNYGKLGTFAMV